MSKAPQHFGNNAHRPSASEGDAFTAQDSLTQEGSAQAASVQETSTQVPSAQEAPEASAALEDETATNVTRSAALMSVLVIISRVTGFFRTWGQAYALGVTALASCYTVANNMPNQLYELVMGGMIMTAFLPVYLSVKKESGRAGANAYASNLLSLVLILMGAVTIVSFVLAGPIIWTQSFSASADFDAELSVYLFRFFVIEVVLYALSSIISGILNAERDYLWSNAAPIFNNVVCTASFVLYAVLKDIKPGLALLSLAVGNPLGVLVQVVMQIPSLLRHGVRLRLRIDLHDPALRDTLSIGIPTLVVTVASFPTVAVQTSSALQVSAAGASVAYYSRLWYMLPYSVFAVPITVAMFTELSHYYAEGNMDAFKQGVRFGSSRILFMLVPFALYLIVFSPQLVTLLASGRFDREGFESTVIYLRWLATALPFYGISTYLQKICSSLRKMAFFAMATIVAAVVQIGFCFATTDLLGLRAVAFSSTLFFAAVDAVTFLRIRKQIGPFGLGSIVLAFMRAFIYGLLGAVVGIIILQFCKQVMGPDLTIMGSLIMCVAAGIPAVLATYGAATLRHVPEASTFTNLLSRFVRR